MRMAVLVLLLALNMGCASSPKLDETPPTLPRAKPVQAMAACNTRSVQEACKYRPEFAGMDLAFQLGMIANCTAILADAFYECVEKQDRLAEFIGE
jgi:hypothetical protein